MTGWQVGLALGIVVILVAALIVIVIVRLAFRIAGQAKTAVGAVDVVRAADRRARRHRADQRLRRADPSRRPIAAEGGGRQMSAHEYWTVALIIGLVAALIVATLLVLLLNAVGSIEKSVNGLLEVAGAVAGNTANIPQLEATAPVLGLIVEEAVVQDGYMNALTDGFGDNHEHQ